MKKNQLEKIIESLGIKAKVLLSDDGEYFVRFRDHDIVSLSMREVVDGKERFVDKWAIYPIINDNRDSNYLSLHNDVSEATGFFKILDKLEIMTESSDGTKYFDLRTLDKPNSWNLDKLLKDLEKWGYKEFQLSHKLKPNLFVL